MRWFKHFTDNHRGQTVQYLLDELGYFGPFFKDTLLEMCAEKLVQKTDRSVTEDDCVFVFHRRVIESATRAKPTSVQRALVCGQSCNFWSFTTDGNYIEIKAPILLDLLEYDQKKSRARRAKIAPGKRLELELELELDKESEKELYNTSQSTKSKVTKAVNPLNKEIWEAYRTSFVNRYNTEPVRNAAVNAKISQLAKRLGPDAVEVVRFFLTHNDSFYLKSLHGIGLCLKDAEALHAQWKRKCAVTGASARLFEKESEFASQWERLGKETLE